jgi:hypothetical protein
MPNESQIRKDSLGHALERCGNAVKSAMLSEEDRPTRVRKAFDLHIGPLREDEFPAELWKRVEKLRRKVHLEPMTPDRPSKCLDEIWSIYEDVAEVYYSRFGKPNP